MRCSRLVTVLLALVLAALLPTAAPAGATTAGGPAAARVAAADDPITITSKVVSPKCPTIRSAILGPIP